MNFLVLQELKNSIIYRKHIIIQTLIKYSPHNYQYETLNGKFKEEDLKKIFKIKKGNNNSEASSSSNNN